MVARAGRLLHGPGCAPVGRLEDRAPVPDGEAGLGTGEPDRRQAGFRGCRSSARQRVFRPGRRRGGRPPLEFQFSRDPGFPILEFRLRPVGVGIKNVVDRIVTEGVPQEADSVERGRIGREFVPGIAAVGAFVEARGSRHHDVALVLAEVGTGHTPGRQLGADQRPGLAGVVAGQDPVGGHPVRLPLEEPDRAGGAVLADLGPGLAGVFAAEGDFARGHHQDARAEDAEALVEEAETIVETVRLAPIAADPVPAAVGAIEQPAVVRPSPAEHDAAIAVPVHRSGGRLASELDELLPGVAAVQRVAAQSHGIPPVGAHAEHGDLASLGMDLDGGPTVGMPRALVDHVPADLLEGRGPGPCSATGRSFGAGCTASRWSGRRPPCRGRCRLDRGRCGRSRA